MDSKGEKIIRVGSRKSELALIQTNHVIDCLKKMYDNVKFEIVTMTTLGDRILGVSLPKIGEKSLFTKDLEDALHQGGVDFVVHSLKDLPTTLPEGLAVGAVFEREDPRDALVLREDLREHTLESLPPLSCVGTSSLRRTAQLHASYPHLRVVDVRGNLNTRLRKLQQRAGNTFSGELDGANSSHHDSGGAGESRGDGQEYAALILAQSGLVRMGWRDKISQVLPCSEMLYAVGQGALAVECRTDNIELLNMLSPFNHAESYCRALVERSFLKTLGGGCSAPVGVSTSLKPIKNQHRLSITGAVWSLDGSVKVEDNIDHVFPQICSDTPSKHRLSPISSVEPKRAKTLEKISDGLNPVEEYNKRITENINMNCEDTRSIEAIEALKESKEAIKEPIEVIMEPIEVIMEPIDILKEPKEALIDPIEAIKEPSKAMAERMNTNCEDKELTGSQSDADFTALTENVSLDSPDLDKNNGGNSAGSSKNGKSEVRLYCGLTKNVKVLIEVVEKCERIGKELAEKLISKGALEVMRVSQEYIRSSIQK